MEKLKLLKNNIEKLEKLNKEMKDFSSVATQQLKVVGNELKETGTKIENTLYITKLLSQKLGLG